MNSGKFQTAALAIYAMKKYSPEAEKLNCERGIVKAVAWLEKAVPGNRIALRGIGETFAL